MQLKMTSKTDDGIVIIACSGRIVYGAESSLLREKIKKALLESNRIVLNLQNISYVDSGGLGTLVGLRTSAQNAAGTLKLANVTKRVSDVPAEAASSIPCWVSVSRCWWAWRWASCSACSGYRHF